MTESLVLLEIETIPPSSNNQYVLIRRGGKTLHVASQELKTFQKHVAQYPLYDPESYALCQAIMDVWKAEKRELEITCTFYLRHSRVFTKEGNPKRMDCSNRLKAIHDSVALLFGIDDCLFFKVHAEKRAISEAFTEKTVVDIRPAIRDR